MIIFAEFFDPEDERWVPARFNITTDTDSCVRIYVIGANDTGYADMRFRVTESALLLAGISRSIEGLEDDD